LRAILGIVTGGASASLNFNVNNLVPGIIFPIPTSGSELPAVSRSVSHPVAASQGKQRLLSHTLEFHMEKLFSHEEFVAVNEHDFRAHAAINTIPAAQVL